MKVLLVNDFSNLSGGAEVLALGLRDELRARGHQAWLLASRAEPVVAAPRQADLECFGASSRLQPLWEPLNPAAALAVRRALRELQPDVVHLNMFLWQLSPAILPFLNVVPTVYYVMTYKAICPIGTKLFPDGRPCDVGAGAACLAHRCLSLQSWIPRMAQRWLWRRWRGAIDRIVPVGETVRRLLAADGIETGEPIAPGIEPGAPRPPLADPPVVAYAGRLVPEKGVEVLVRAFALLARAPGEATLEILGEGPERRPLEALAAELEIASRVRFLGRLDRAASERRLARAWVQVVPSIWPEPFGLVVIEAMMRGTALIVTEGGEPAHVVEPGRTGLHVPPGDVAALANALRDLLGSRERAEIMGRAGRAHARTHFQRSMFVDRFEGLYRSLAGSAA